MKKALEQAKNYELKIRSRVGYLANEEKKLIGKIIVNRPKALKNQNLSSQRDEFVK